MRCPRCKQVFNILAFRQLEIPTEFEEELTPIYKCSKGAKSKDGRNGCNFLFAPAPTALEMWMGVPSHDQTR